MKQLSSTQKEYVTGVKDGLPIGIAYVAVSFTFGLVAVNEGVPFWLATLISGTNLTSAGQFAGLKMMIASASFAEIILAVFVINSRYMLMSLSLTQNIEPKTGTVKRLVMSFFVTDEIFALSAMRKKLTFSYFMGVSLIPYFGWTIGTLLGGLCNTLLPTSLQNAMGIALYCMFIAIIVPPAKKSKAIVFCIAVATFLSCLLYYVPFLSDNISFGFGVIISSILSASLTALLFPVREEEKKREENKEEK